MATNNPKQPPIDDDKVANTTATAVEEDAPPAGWMRLNPMGRNKRSSARTAGNAQDPKHLAQVNTGSSVNGSGDYSSFQETGQNDGLLSTGAGDNEISRVETNASLGQAPTGGCNAVVYKVYKRRWFGLVQMVLLNIIVSWDWLSFSAISTTSSQYFNVSTTAISWVATSFLFSFVAICPFTVWTLHHHGPKTSILIASVLLLVGNWIRYGGTKANNFGVVIFGQILIGLAQPFVLASPTRYSDMWFTGAGRVTATAVMSLANPLGGALGQLINPFWATKPSEIPNMVLYVSILSSVATVPSFFIPSHPPTPSSASSAEAKQALGKSLRYLFTFPEFYMIMIPFVVYVALFNSVSSLINNILFPYDFSETEAGIAGALLIVVGLVAAAITSPIIDRSKGFVLAIKLCVPVIAAAYLAFIWAPPTKQVAAVYTVLSILGAASFSLMPAVLEYLCEITHPVSPEVTSTICWSGGQLVGGILIIVSNALSDGPHGGKGGPVPFNYQRALWLQAVIALIVVPLPLALGCFGRSRKIRLLRVEADKYRTSTNESVESGNGTTGPVLPGAV